MNSVFLTATVLLLAAHYAAGGCPFSCEKNVVAIDNDPECICYFLKCYGDCGTTDIATLTKPCWKSCVKACAANSACKAAVYTAGGTCKLKGAACKRCGTLTPSLTNRRDHSYQYYEKIGECGDREHGCVSQNGQCRLTSLCAPHTSVPNAHCPPGKSCCRLKTCVDVGGSCRSSQCTPSTREVLGTCGDGKVCCKTPECFLPPNNGNGFRGFCHSSPCAPPNFTPFGGNQPGRKGCGQNEYCCKCQGQDKYPIWDASLNSFKCIGEDQSRCKTRRDITGFCVHPNGCKNPNKGTIMGPEDCPGATECCHCPTDPNKNTQWYPVGNNIRGGFCGIHEKLCTAAGGYCIMQKNAQKCPLGYAATGLCPSKVPHCCKT